MFNLVKSFKLLSKLSQLEPILDCIEEVKTSKGGALYIKLKSDFILDTEGNQVLYTKDGQSIIQSSRLHLNPDVEMGKDLREIRVSSVNSKIQGKLEKQEELRLKKLDNYDKNVNECTCNDHGLDQINK